MATYYLMIFFKALKANKATLFVVFLHILAILIAFSFSANAQSRSGAPGLGEEEYQYLKQIKIENLEEDTYLKLNNTYILDREKKPFVFKFSDGIERRVYLYKVLDNESRKGLALLAVYHTPANNQSINVCIPNQESDRNIWNLYIDDLKDQGAAEEGFLSCVSFALSKELSSFTTEELAKQSSSADADDYDFCFPAGSLVSIGNDKYKAIEDLLPGEKITGYESVAKEAISISVAKVIKHKGGSEQISISKVTLVPLEELTASSLPYIELVEFEATASHPVLAERGKVKVGELTTEDVLLRYDKTSQQFKKFKVMSLEHNSRLVQEVYTLEIEGDNFLINDVVMLEK